jgi:hypothetical protein
MLMLFSFTTSQAQYDRYWLMGYDCCTPNSGGMNWDFAGGSPVISYVQRYMNFNTTNGTISDQNGNLLFYSNGIYVANSLDDTMQNGSGLNPGYLTTSRYDNGLSIPQGNIVIPFPGDSTKYYLFHETAEHPQSVYLTFQLLYSVIDMTLDSGKGGVVQKNTVLLDDTLIIGRLTAVKHANGRDWWLMSHKWNSGRIYKFLITPYGIQGPFIQNIFTIRLNYAGQMLFSPQGDKFAYYDPEGDLDVWDFDRCSGNFSNRRFVTIVDSSAAGGAAFSATGKYLYVSSMSYVYQFDVNDILNTQTTVAVYDGFLSLGLACNFFLAALAPDGKIYINSGNGSNDIHVINNPDSAGAACDFCQHCIHLPAANAFTMPNYPNYYLGPLTGTACDSLSTAIFPVKVPLDAFNIFPNPASEIFYLTLASEKVSDAKVCNSMGQFQSVEVVSVNENYLSFNTVFLVPGVYFVSFQSKQGRIVRRVVVK